MSDCELLTLAIDQIVPSAANPRRSFDPVADAEMLASVRESGILQTLLVRAIDGERYELIDGFRRWCAAKECGLVTVPAMVSFAADEEARLNALTANIQRKDLAPLDQARAFRALLDFTTGSHTPATLAAAVGKTEREVWDTLKLLDLVPDAQRLLADGILPLSHAQILAKLAPADQARAIKARDGQYDRKCAVFEEDGGFDFGGDGKRKPGKYYGLKPVSVRELQRWVQDHVRFDPAHAAAAAPLDFAETAQAIEAKAAEPGRGKKVVSITYDSYIQPDAKTGKGDERIYAARSWARADGQHKSKRCEASVLGVVVVGPHYGETFDVCVRKGCPVHWPEDKKAKAKQARAAAKAGPQTEAPWQREQRLRDRNDQAWKVVYSRFLEALIAGTAKVKTTDAHLVKAIGLENLDDAAARAIRAAVGSITYKTFGRAFTLAEALDRVRLGYFDEPIVGQALKIPGVRFDLKAAMKAAIKAIEKPAAVSGEDKGEKADPAAPAKKKAVPL